MSKTTDYKVLWTPELREAVDNRIIEYLLQGYSQQEAEERGLLDLLDHTTFKYPEVTVTAQAPVQKQVAVESDWDTGYTKFMSGERYYADQDHKNYLDWQRNDYTNGIRQATDKWGKGMGHLMETVSGFTPLWWVAPAVRTGLDLSEGNYKRAALNAGLAFAAPYAVGKGIQYITPYAKSAILANKLNRLINKTTLPQYSTRYYTKSVGLPGHVNYTLYNADGSVAGGLRVESPYSAGTRGTHIEMVHKTSGSKGGVSEDLYNIAVKDALRAGLPGVESGLDLRNPLLTKHVTSKFPNIELMIGTPQMVKNPTTGKWEFQQIIPGRMLTGTTSKLLALEAPQGHFIPNYSAAATNTPPKTSLAFFERQPANISKAERLGIPKGERNAYLQGSNADPSYYAGIGLGNQKYLQLLRDYHFASKFGLNGVNQNGLITFYHGSPNPNKVSLRRPGIKYGGRATNGVGWYATTNPKYAQRYTYPDLLRSTIPTGKVYEVYVNSQNPYVFGTHQAIGNLSITDITSPTLASMKKYWRNGFLDLYYPFKMGNKGSEYVIFNPTLFKFKDPITYDNNGSIIPLSRRDNPTLNDLRFKSGGSIKIKKKNKGSFTRYCNGKVTEECIRKGKNSSNPTTRKRANFAWVARHKFKHEDGGKLNYLNYFN